MRPIAREGMMGVHSAESAIYDCLVLQLLTSFSYKVTNLKHTQRRILKGQLECGPMPNVMAALPNIGGALCSTPQSLADA